MVHEMLIPMLIVLYFYISTFRSMCTVHNMTVFCSSLVRASCMVLVYFFNDSEIVPVTPFSNSITFTSTFHMCYISIVWSPHFTLFSPSFLIPFLSPKNARSVNIHVPSSLLEIMASNC